MPHILPHNRGGFASGGNTATTTLLIQVEDVSDQPPEFVVVPSVTRISEDIQPFSEVSQLKSYYLKAIIK